MNPIEVGFEPIPHDMTSELLIAGGLIGGRLLAITKDLQYNLDSCLPPPLAGLLQRSIPVELAVKRLTPQHPLHRRQAGRHF